jgi:type VI secretion system protein ImpC
VLEVEPVTAPLREAPDPETPFCVALLGDFSGRESRGILEIGSALANRRAVLVDRDNFEDVLAKFHPEIKLPAGGESDSLGLKFSELDDFHPDRIVERAQMFRRLREARIRLNDPATFAAAAEELGLAPATAKASKPAPQPSRPPAASDLLPPSGSFLDAVIEEATIEDATPEEAIGSGWPTTNDQQRTTSSHRQSPRSRVPDDLERFVRRVTEPHLAAVPDSRQAEVLAVIDRALSSQMRALLHVPAFQALEAAWRAVFLLVRRLETDSQLKLYLIDISKPELAEDLGGSQDLPSADLPRADLRSADLRSKDLRSAGLFRLLVDRSVGTPGAEPWALVVGNYTFGPNRQDASILARLAQIASAAGAPFLAGASPRAVGCESFAETPYPEDWKAEAEGDDSAAWAALRQLPEAGYLGLALPRFLLRLPYGPTTDPVESFSFEEMPDSPAHEDYLWGNPAFACALLLAQSFSDNGWQMRPGAPSELDGLPLHVYKRDSDSELKPCAEALLTERAAGKILERGPMPLVWLKGQDAVRLVRFQSMAEPLGALKGKW